MDIARKTKYVILFIIIHMCFYSILQHAFPNSEYSFYFSLDEFIPFIPEFIWVYHTLIPAIIFTTIVLMRRKTCFFTVYTACLLASASLFIFYILFPAHYPRGGLIEEITISEWLVNWTRILDKANNTFPSSHVTFSWLMFLSVVNCKTLKGHKIIKFLYLVWALTIAVSTLVLKQHFIIDVASGIILASTSYHLGTKIIADHQKKYPDKWKSSENI